MAGTRRPGHDEPTARNHMRQHCLKGSCQPSGWRKGLRRSPLHTTATCVPRTCSRWATS